MMAPLHMGQGSNVTNSSHCHSRPPAKGFAGCVDGKQFGVVDGIFAALSQVVGTGNDLAILGNHRANGHFTQSGAARASSSAACISCSPVIALPHTVQVHRKAHQKQNTYGIRQAGKNGQRLHAAAQPGGKAEPLHFDPPYQKKRRQRQGH